MSIAIHRMNNHDYTAPYASSYFYSTRTRKRVSWSYFLSVLASTLLAHTVGAFGQAFTGLPDGNFGPDNIMPFADMRNSAKVRYTLNLPTDLSIEGTTVPLKFIFNGSQLISPSLGLASWMFPLFDASIVQINERRFEAMLPDGNKIILERDLKKPHILNGFGKWKANIEDDIITLNSDPGVSLVFRGGKIQKWRMNKVELFYTKTSSDTTSLVCGGKTVAELRRSNENNSELFLNGKNVLQVKSTDASIVQTIGGRNLVGGISKSVGSIRFEGREINRFEYALDDKMYPTLHIHGLNPKTVSWDPVNLQLRSIDDSKFTFSFSEESPSANFKVIWKEDGESPKVFEQRSNGATTETFTSQSDSYVDTVFTSGVLKGKLRNTLTMQAGKLVSERRLFYDENGKPIRENLMRKQGTIQINYRYEDSQRLTEVTAARKGESNIVYTFEEGKFLTKKYVPIENE